MTGKTVAKREERSLEQRLGEIDLNDHVACAVLLDDIRTLEGQLASAKSSLTAAIVEAGKRDGTTSYELPNRLKATITSGKRTSVAGDVLAQQLRSAGMPEERIAEIVSETVSYSVDLRKAKTAAGVNEAYAKALATASTTHEAQPSVTIRRR